MATFKKGIAVKKWLLATVAVMVLMPANTALANDDAPILGTWTWGEGSDARQIKVTSAGGGSYVGTYLGGVDDCGNSLGGFVNWRMAGSGKNYSGSTEWLQTSPECKSIGPGTATLTLDSDITGTLCVTSPNREVVDQCIPIVKIDTPPPPKPSSDLWKWLLALLAALLAGAGAAWYKRWFKFKFWWNRAHTSVRGELGKTLDSALQNSGGVQTAGSVPGATVPLQVAGKAAGTLSTAKTMGDIAGGSPTFLENSGQSSLSSAGSEYMLSGDQTRFELIDKIASSGNEGAVVKAHNLLHAKGNAAVTVADLQSIIAEFGL
ncbi:hypothetical protein [Catellatospora tritici]|uniref:hypothetical protein n=1 Tax=Catellatospora tritici TaxID=2851566 RepID=UPI001C2DDEA3|nr:hypothetical protein [Catellatospora tritici]MBV1856126.1 hypothetical protein [Catellatospora tritici]